MVRSGLGVDARGGHVRAAAATDATRLVVVEDAPFLDLGEALRVALASARARFGEPEAIALVHDDDLPEAELDRLRLDAQSAGVGEVRLVPDSTARSFAENEDVAPPAVAATGAAIWLLRARRGMVVPPPVVPSADEEDEDARRMGDFGAGRTMADFGAGSAMADLGDGRTMADFGDGRTMSDFGAGVQMADFGDSRRRKRRSRVVVAAIAAALLVVGGAVAAIALTGGTTEVDSVASTHTTDTTDASDDGDVPTSSSTSEDLQPGERTTSSDASAAPVESTTTTTAVAGGAGAATTTTSPPVTTTTTVPGSTTRTYDVAALVESYTIDPPMPARLRQGDRAPGTVTLVCDQNQACTGTVSVPDWSFTQDFAGTLVDGTLVSSRTETRSEPCTQPVTVTFDFSGDFTDTTAAGQASQTHTPRTCDSADGTTAHFEDITISFGP